MMRRFHLRRDGVAEPVAEGAMFSDGMTVLHWRKDPNDNATVRLGTPPPSTMVYHSIQGVEESHKRRGAHIEWVDE